MDQTEKKSKNLELFQFRNSSIRYKYVRIKEIGLPNARNVGVGTPSTNLVILLMTIAFLIKLWSRAIAKYLTHKNQISGVLVDA